MENMNKKVKRMARGNARRKLWHRAVAIPAAIVVFITTYALILPAIAMERDTYCGFEAHQHTEECYAAQLACGYEDGATVQDVQLVTELACGAEAHQHTADCYDETGAVICGYADYLVHQHNADCYAADGTLVCPLPEVEAHTHDENCYVDEIVNVCGQAESAGHIHTEDCYSLVSHPELVCGQAESAGHIHTEDCYTTREVTSLVCGMEESEGHFHDESCCNEAGELVCGLEETPGHTHTDACYITEPVTELTCTEPESAGHTHTEACWANVETLELTCGQAESAGHTHTDACFATAKRLVCTKPEVILHTHNDDCYTVTVAEDGTETRELTCTQTVVEEHVHTADCFNTYEQTIERPHQHTDLCYVQTLVCTLPEHEHTDDCYVAPEAPEAPEYVCGLEGHTHTELCYDEAGELTCGLEEHIHTEACLGGQAEIGGEIAELPDGNVEIVQDDTPAFQMPVLACGLEEHEHSTACMDENMNYVCGVTAHVHTGECYAIPGLAGVTPILVCSEHEHFHTEACYNENGELACGLNEHTHGVGCFALPEGVADPDVASETDETVYWCGYEAHAHSDACLDANGEIVCGLPEHEHTDECLVEPAWTCGYEAHTHGESCFDESGALTCKVPEHTHTDACQQAVETFCGYKAHVHGVSCYDENGALTCLLPEHQHTDACRVENFTQMALAEGVLVTARYTSEAGFPADAALQVARLEEEGEHFDDRASEAQALLEQDDKTLQPLALLNIGFYLPDGTEVEPAAPVAVTVQLLGADGLAEGEQYTVIHYGEAGTEQLDTDNAESTLNFSAKSFSDFMISYDMDPSDEGSNGADGDKNEDSGSSGSEAVPPINWGNFLVGSSSQTRSYASSSGYMTMAYGNGGATEFAHNKYIDYLGDNKSGGQNNTDTGADEQKVTDDLYRLYLDMEGESEPVDLLIVIDRSNSMVRDMSDNETTVEDNRKWKVVYNILEGKNSDGSDGLLYQFLKGNAGKPEDEQNYVSVVWFAGEFYSRTLDNRYGSVKYDIAPDSAQEGGTVFNWTSSYTKHPTDGYSISPYAGDTAAGGVACTNYVAGMYQADKMLNSTLPAMKNHRRVVLFMSDGIPVYYYMSGDMDWDNPSSMKRYGGGAESCTFKDFSINRNDDYTTTTNSKGETVNVPIIYDCTEHPNDSNRYTNCEYSNLIASYMYSNVTDSAGNRAGTASGHHAAATDLKDFYYSPYFNETKRIFSQFVARHQEIGFHTVGIALNSKINGWDRTTLLKDMADFYSGGTMYSATNMDGLKKYLQSVMFPAGVTITDDLSDYVELYGEMPDIKVTAALKPDGEPFDLWTYIGKPLNDSSIAGDFTTNKVGDTLPRDMIDSVTYSGGVITLKFKSDYCLSGDYTYTLSFNVRLTEKAYNDYAANMNKGLPYGSIQGDENTDYKGTDNKTSSQMHGLYSNDDAYVSFKIGDPNGSGGGTLHYSHPVVQAWGTQFKFTKTVDGSSRNKVSGFPFQLRWKATGASDFTTYADFPGAENCKSMDPASDGWYHTGEDGSIGFGYLPCGEYELWELVPEQYKIDGAGLDQSGRQVKWLSFKVVKGRIIDVRTAAGVSWKGDDFSVMTSYSANSKPNDNYFAGQGNITVDNESYRKPLAVYKADKSGKNYLSGAEFSLQRYVGGSTEPWMELTDAELAALGKWNEQSDENGLVFDGELPYGIYRLLEETAPVNYQKNDSYVYFKVTEDGAQLLEEDLKTPVEGDTYKDFVKQEWLKESGQVHPGHGVGVRKDRTLRLTFLDEPADVVWQLKKVDSSNDTAVLQGAKFDLYGPYDEATQFHAEAPDADKQIFTGETGEDGLLQGSGAYATAEGLPPLTAGKYYFLVETEAPEGFFKLDGPVQLHAKEDVDPATGERSVTLTVTHNDTKTLTPDPDTNPPMYTVTVGNSTGYELPESGGMGTAIYTLSGLALLALAGAMFCAQQRRRARG